MGYEILNTENKLSKIELLEHQQKTLNWMLKNKLNGGIIHLEMGLGKTLLSLYYCYLYMSKNLDSKIMIIATKTLVLEWEKCYEKFFLTNDIKMNILFADSKKDIIDFQNSNIIILTYNVLISLNKNEDHYKKYISPNIVEYNGKTQYISLPDLENNEKSSNFSSPYDLVWDIIIADESQNFSNPNTKLFEYMISLKGKQKWCLTGTPIRNYNTDIWSQLRFCGYDDIKTSKQWALSYSSITNYKEYIFTLNYQDTNITLPIKNEHIVLVNLDQQYTDNYLEILNETKKAVEDFEIGKTTYVNILSKFTKLRYATLSDGERLFETSPSGEQIENSNKIPPKITEIIKILNSLETQKQVVIFCSSAKYLSIIKKFLDETYDINTLKFITSDVVCGKTEISKREEIIENFKSGKIRVLLLTYKVGGEGLNLTCGKVCIFCDQWWNPAIQKQATSRIWRIGQTSEVDIYHLLAIYSKNSTTNKTIDFKVMDICQKKNKMASEILNSNKNEKLDLDTLKFFIS